MSQEPKILTCQNPRCGKPLIGNQTKWCSDACRKEAGRMNPDEPGKTTRTNSIEPGQTARTSPDKWPGQTQKTMEKPLIGEQNNDLMLHPGSQIFGNGAQNALYQNKVQELVKAQGRMEGLEQMVTSLQEQNLSLTNSLRDQKNEYELKLIKVDALHKDAVREKEEEIKELNRELVGIQNANSLGSIANKALEKENAIPELFKGFSSLLSSAAELKNGLTEDQRILLKIYRGLTPQYKDAFDRFVVTMSHMGIEGINFINQFLAQHGTISNAGGQQHAEPNPAAQQG